MPFLIFIAIGAISGWMAGQFMRGRGFGLLGDIVVGIAGAFAGGMLWRGLGGLAGSVVAALLGALLLLFVVRLFIGRPEGKGSWS